MMHVFLQYSNHSTYVQKKTTTIPYMHIYNINIYIYINIYTYNNKSKLPLVSDFIPTSFNQKKSHVRDLHGRHQQFGTLHLILKDVEWRYPRSTLSILAKPENFRDHKNPEIRWNKETSQLLGVTSF